MLREVSHLRFFSERTIDVKPRKNFSHEDVEFRKYGGSFHFFVNNVKRTIMWKVSDSLILTLCEVCGGKTKTVQIRFKVNLLSYVYFSQNELDIHVYCLTPPYFHVFTLSLPKNSVGGEENFSYLASLYEVNEYHHRFKSIPDCVNIERFILLTDKSFAFIKKNNEQHLHVVRFDDLELNRYSSFSLTDLTYFSSFFRWNAAGERYVDMIEKPAPPNNFLFVLTDRLNVKIFEINTQKFVTSFSFLPPNSKETIPSPEEIRFCHKPLQSHVRDGNLYLICYYYTDESQDAAFRILQIKWENNQFERRIRPPLLIKTDDRELLDFQVGGDDKGECVCLWRCPGKKNGFPYYDVNIGSLIDRTSSRIEWVRITTIWDTLREELECHPDDPDLVLFQYPNVISETLTEYYGCAPGIESLSDFEIREKVRDHIMKQAEHKYPNRELEPNEMDKIRNEEVGRFWRYVLSNWMKKYQPFAIYTYDNELRGDDDDEYNTLVRGNIDGANENQLKFHRTNFGLMSAKEMRVLRKTNNFVELLYRNNINGRERLLFCNQLLSGPQDNCLKKSFRQHELSLDQEDQEGVTSQHLLMLLECVEMLSRDLGTPTLFLFDKAMDRFEGGKTEELMALVMRNFHPKLLFYFGEGSLVNEETQQNRMKFFQEIKRRLNRIPNIQNVVFLVVTVLNFLWETPEFEVSKNTINQQLNGSSEEKEEEVPSFLSPTTGFQPLLYEATRQLISSEYGFIRDYFLFINFVSLNFRSLFMTSEEATPRNRAFQRFHGDLDGVMGKTRELLSSYFRAKWICAQQFQHGDSFFLSHVKSSVSYQAKSAIDLVFNEELSASMPLMNVSDVTNYSKQLFSFLMFCRVRPQVHVCPTIVSPEELDHLKRFLFGLLKYRQIDLLHSYCRFFRNSTYPFFMHFMGVTYIHQRKIELAKDCFERVKQHLFEDSLHDDEEEEEEEGEDDEENGKSQKSTIRPSWTFLFLPPSETPPNQASLIKSPFDYYFFLVTSVFPEQPELVHHFGSAALLEIKRNMDQEEEEEEECEEEEEDQTTNEAVGVLLSKLFVVCLGLERYDDCLRFIVQMKSDPHERENNLSLLMTNMIENGRTNDFIKGWTQASHSVETQWGVGEAVLPSPQIGRVLWRKARQSEVLAKIGKARLYEVLFSFFFHRKMYDQASSFMYEYAQRIVDEQILAKTSNQKENLLRSRGEKKLMKDEEDEGETDDDEEIQESKNEVHENDPTLIELNRQNMIRALQLRSNGLSICLSSLSVTNHDSRFLVYSDTFDGPESESEERIVSSEDLEREYVTNEAYLKLLIARKITIYELFKFDDPQVLLNMLSMTVFSDLAFTYAEKFGLERIVIFRGLARGMVKFSRRSMVDEDEEDDDDDDDEEEETRRRKGELVKDCRVENDILNFLKLYPQREYFVEIFDTLMSMMVKVVGKEGSLARIPNFVANWLDVNAKSELLRLFLKYDLVVVSVELVNRYLSTRDGIGHAEVDKKVKSQYISPNFLDHLIEMMKRYRFPQREIEDLENKLNNIL